ncbi:hypothetical protein GCM10022223_05550 [Kineosporia mesophila]|uniref:Uncharacterized protein n=1 Tax=Kineosporia mesophila TaxID=566012 RepID=A0ABP6YY73_9ACTN
MEPQNDASAGAVVPELELDVELGTVVAVASSLGVSSLEDVGGVDSPGASVVGAAVVVGAVVAPALVVGRGCPGP